jgi:hypothetical protein
MRLHFLTTGSRAVLPYLTVEDLKEIGVATVGDRRMLLAAIDADVFRADRAAAFSFTTSKAPEVSAERRPITVMFCDLAGSTGLAAQLDAEDWRNLVNTYLDEASVDHDRTRTKADARDELRRLAGVPRVQVSERALDEKRGAHRAFGVILLRAGIAEERHQPIAEPLQHMEAPNIAARV